MRPQISIIISVYNSEKYLDRCLKSVVNQTISNFEILIINDGSTDRSLDIIKEYADKYNNIVYYSQDNKGQGIARNYGILKSHGEYIGFVDSDDVVGKTMFKNMYNEAHKNNLDMVICNFDFTNENLKRITCFNHKEYTGRILSSHEAINQFLISRTELIEGYPWNKIYKRKLFIDNNIFFPSIKFEDSPTVLNLIIHSDRIKYVNEIYYHYVQRNNSTANIVRRNILEDYLLSIDMIRKLLRKNNLHNIFREQYFYYSTKKYLDIYGKYYKIIRKNRKIKRKMHNLLKELTLIKCIKFSSINKKTVLKAFLYKLNLLGFVHTIYLKLR